MTGGGRFAEQGERKRARQELDEAEALLLDQRDDHRLEIDARRRFIADMRIWTWVGRFCGWPASEVSVEMPERVSSLFDTEEFSRFLLGGTLLAVASANGGAMLVISKSIDDLHKSPISGVDWAALKAGVGPPRSEHDYIVVYSAGKRFLSFWMPIVPIDPVFVGAFNAVIAASAPAVDGVYNGEVQTEGDDWTTVLRRLIDARRQCDELRPSEKQVERRGVVAHKAAWCANSERISTHHQAGDPA